MSLVSVSFEAQYEFYFPFQRHAHARDLQEGSCRLSCAGRVATRVVHVERFEPLPPAAAEGCFFVLLRSAQDDSVLFLGITAYRPFPASLSRGVWANGISSAPAREQGTGWYLYFFQEAFPCQLSQHVLTGRAPCAWRWTVRGHRTMTPHSALRRC